MSNPLMQLEHANPTKVFICLYLIDAAFLLQTRKVLKSQAKKILLFTEMQVTKKSSVGRLQIFFINLIEFFK